MDWILEILNKTQKKDNGELDIEAVMNAIKKEFPNHAVPKEDFNNKVKELETANGTIKELKKTNADNEDLQKKVTDYETEITNLKKAAEDTSKTYLLKEQLSKHGVLDPDYLIYKAGGLDKFTFDKDNKPVGVEEFVKPYKEDTTLAHLFKTEKKQQYTPGNGGAGGNENPFSKESYNLTKQGELLRNNPEQARALAAAAGVKL